MPENYRKSYVEVVVPGQRLGRSVNHDPRSLQYRVEPDGTVASARWDRVTPVLDQGDLGSCTGNAACGVLGSQPFYASLADHSPAIVLDEKEAVSLYSAATKIDDYAGTYPPTDSGSSGLAVAKAAKAAGFISGYQHITSLAAAQTAIQSGPFIVGTEWLTGMDNPDSAGLVHATGTVRGGHEYECLGYNATTDAWELVNSWGPTWGKGGHFFYSSADFTRLLKAQGDATVFIPLTQPAPTPTPVPVSADQTLADATRAWSLARHTSPDNHAAALAVTAWRTTKGL